MSIKPSAEKLALRRAAEILGGQAGLAKAIGYEDRRHVWPWINTSRPFPEELCPSLEMAVEGRVTCEELRPDVTWVRVKDRSWVWHPRGKPLLDVLPVIESAG